MSVPWIILPLTSAVRKSSLQAKGASGGRLGDGGKGGFGGGEGGSEGCGGGVGYPPWPSKQYLEIGDS